MKKDMSNIWRHDNDEKYQHYWYVRFQAVGIGKTFSDGVHGGKRIALAVAIKYRDKMRKKYPRSYTGDNLRRKSYKKARGVFLRLRGNEASWIACWNEIVEGESRQRQKSFRVYRYGTRKAKKLAVACRKANIQ